MKSTYTKPQYPGVYPRANGSWYIKLAFTDPDTNEKIRINHSDNYKTAGDAHNARCKYVEQINVLGVPEFYSTKQAEMGNSLISASMAVQEYITYWFEAVHEPQVSQQTAIGDESDIRLHIIPAVGQKKLGKLTSKDISIMCEHMRLRKEFGGKGLKCRTADRALTILASALSYAVDQGAIKKNVALGVRISPDEEGFQPVLITKEQVKRLIQTSKAYSNGIGFEIQLKTGLRSAEVRGLKYSDVDFQSSTIRIQRQIIALSRDGKKVFEVTSKLKTKGSKRVVPVPPDLLAEIQARKEAIKAKKEQSGEPFNNQSFIVCDKDGNFLKPRPYYDAFKRILKRASLLDMRNHDLRHTFATMCAEAGMPEKILANTLGHSSTAMVQKYYVGNIDGSSIAASTIKSLFSDL